MGEDGKAVISSIKPLPVRVIGTRRNGLYPFYGDWLWLPGLCREWVDKVFGFVPPPNEPLQCDMVIVPTRAIPDGAQNGTLTDKPHEE